MITRNFLTKVRERGFTLTELLVVMFIIGLITISVLANFWRGQNQYSVAVSVQKFQSNLRRVQNMALSGKQVPTGCVAPNCAKGFGIYSKSANNYIIFYNIDNGKVYDIATSVVLENIALDKVLLSPVGKSIFFVPPDPTTYIDGSNSGSQVFTVTNNGYSRVVTVNFSGLIQAN